MENNKKEGVFAKFIQKMKANKKLEITVYAVLGIAAFVIFASGLFSPGDNSTSDSGSSGNIDMSVSVVSDNDIEAKLSEVLSGIRGAGDVKVMITYDTSKQIVPALSTQTNESDGSSQGKNKSESSEPATVKRNGNEEPIVLTEIQPTVRGVIVIAQGAADISVRMNLQRAVQTVLGIDASCIEVFEMDNTNTN